jgi:hypothetical protein
MRRQGCRAIPGLSLQTFTRALERPSSTVNTPEIHGSVAVVWKRSFFYGVHHYIVLVIPLFPSSFIMNCSRFAIVLVGGVIIILGGLSASEASLKQGDSATIAGREITVEKLSSLPFIDNEYSRRFKFDSVTNPKLKVLRDRYQLEEVVAPGRDELDQQVLLMDWVHHQFKKFGHPSVNAKGAIEILRAIDDGQTFFCSQYAQVFVSAAAALGWVDRPLALRRHQDGGKNGSSEHSSTEIWSNQYSKWVMLDPTSNMYLERHGVPLNAFEIREEWFYHGGTNLVFVIGKEHKRYHKADLPIFLTHFAEFGNLEVGRDELDKYGFTAYIPNTDLMDSGFDYGKMFIVKDKLCDGTNWHVRQVPAHPESEPYFPIGQASITLEPGAKSIRVVARTLTPNFKSFEARVDEGVWNSSGESLNWPIHSGENHFEMRTVNEFGVRGPVSSVVVRGGGDAALVK